MVKIITQVDYKLAQTVYKLCKEKLPHNIHKLIESMDKTELKSAIAQMRSDGEITTEQYDQIKNKVIRLNEIKEMQPLLLEMWNDADNEIPILARESESGFIYPIEKYWIGHQLDEVSTSEYLPKKGDVIEMYGTEFEMISPLTILTGYYEVK